MKTIYFYISGTDHTPHGHGCWTLDGGSLNVTDEQYEIIKKCFDEGEVNLEEMNVPGLNKVIDRLRQEQLDIMESVGRDVSDIDLEFNVCDIEQ